MPDPIGPRTAHITGAERTAVVVAAAVSVFAWLFRYNDPGGSFAGLTDDHFFYLVRGWQILVGDLPVRDFVDHGAPLFYYLGAAVQLVCGRGTWSELMFCTTALSLSAALVFLLAWRASGSIAFGLIGAAFHIFLGPRFYNYPKMLVYAVAIPALWAFADRQSATRRFSVALITAVAFLFRHDHGAFVAAGMALLLVALTDVPWRARLRHGVVYGSLVVALLSPYLLFLQLNGGVVPYFESAASWADRDRDRAPVVWPGLFDNPEGVSDAAQDGPLLARARAIAHDNRVAWLFYMMAVLPFVSLAALAASRQAFRPDWPRAGAKLAVVAGLGVVLNVGFLRSPLAARLADPSVPHAILIAWLGAGVMRACLNRDSLRPALQRVALGARLGLVVSALPVALVVTVLLTDDSYNRLDKAILLEGPGRAFRRVGIVTSSLKRRWPIDTTRGDEAQGVMKLAVYLRECTSENDRVFMGLYLPQVLALADRAFAGGHGDLRRGFFNSSDDQRLTLSRLRRQSVPVAVLGTAEYEGFRESFPLIASYFDDRYRVAGDRALDERFSIKLLVKKDLIPRRTYRRLDWPCFR